MKGTPNKAGYPAVQGVCPACGFRALFLASQGYVTCSIAECPNPSAASESLGVNLVYRGKR